MLEMVGFYINSLLKCHFFMNKYFNKTCMISPLENVIEIFSLLNKSINGLKEFLKMPLI